MGKVSESIFSGKTAIIPMADVQHIEKDQRANFEDARIVILKSTRWSFEHDCWDNVIYLRHDEAEAFMKSWCYYRGELEAEAIKSPHEMAAKR